MNARRGMKRLIIVIAVPWFVVWGALALMDWRISRNYHAEARLPQTGTCEAYEFAHSTVAIIASDADNRLLQDALWGLGLPIFLTVLGIVVIWVFRGFARN